MKPQDVLELGRLRALGCGLKIVGMRQEYINSGSGVLYYSAEAVHKVLGEASVCHKGSEKGIDLGFSIYPIPSLTDKIMGLVRTHPDDPVTFRVKLTKLLAEELEGRE